MKTGRRRTDGIRKRRDTGMWFWRRVDPRTGRRVGRSTGTTRKDHALKIAAQFDEEWERERAGLASYDWARRELEPLVRHLRHVSQAWFLPSFASPISRVLGGELCKSCGLRWNLKPPRKQP